MHSCHSRRSQYQFLLVCVLVLSTIGLLPGCGLVAPTQEPVTISFAHPAVDSDYYTRLADEFHQKHSYITIDLQPQQSQDFGWINVGEADTFVTSQFALGELLDRDLVLNLTPYISQNTGIQPNNFYPGTLNLYSSEGKTWAVPAGGDVMVMFYNKDLLDTYGVAYPQNGWTWDDFLATASQISDPDHGVFGYAPNYNAFDPLLFVYQGGGRLFDNLQNPTRTTFDDPANVAALEWFVNLIYQYDVAPSPDQVRDLYGTSGGIAGGVLGGKIGMWTGNLSDRGGRADGSKWPMSWGAVTLPRDEEAATMVTLSGYFISSQAEAPDICWEWISFLTQYPPQRQTPVQRSQLESSTYEQQVGADIAAVAQASMEHSLLLSPRLVEFQQALGIFQQAVEAIVALRATPEEAMVQAQALSNR